MPIDSAFWENEKRRLMAIFLPRLTQMALTGMTNAARQAGISFDNTLYSKRAEAWARTYTDQLLADFGTTTEKIVGGAVADWIAKPNMTVGDLDAALTPAFGATRANAIAVTETTRAFAQGQLEAYKAEGIDEAIWSTNRDDITCPTCGPLHNKRVKIGNAFGKDKKGNDIFQPPAHPRCRCYVRPGVSKKPKDEPKEIPNEVIAQIQDANTQAAEAMSQSVVWKSVMSRAEAEKWVENSVVRETVSHVTKPENATGIKQNGFSLGKVTAGRVWGNGVYVGLDNEAEEFYKSIYTPMSANGQPAKLEVKINVKNVLTVDVSSLDSTYYKTKGIMDKNNYNFIADQIPNGDERFRALKVEIKNEGIIKYEREIETEALTRLLKESGYDALKITDSTFRERVGGNQIIIFDPRNVTVIDEK